MQTDSETAQPTIEEILESEKYLAETIFKDKSQAFLDTRKWIHTNPLKAKEMIAALSESNPKFRDLSGDPDLWFRQEQFLEWGDKKTMLLLAGRGWGKTHFSSNYIISEMQRKKQVIVLFAADYNSAKRTNFFGSSGIISCMSPDLLDKCEVNKTDLTITFPNGSHLISISTENFVKAKGLSADQVIMDELANYIYAEETLIEARLILRLGEMKLLITTTPTPTKIIRDLVADDDVKVISGKSSDNYFLPQSYAVGLKKKLSRRMWQQEGLALLHDENPYAMFKQSDIDQCRVKLEDLDLYSFHRFVIAVDPSLGGDDLTGIVVMGLFEGKYYILEDQTMEHPTPEQWSKRVINLFSKYNEYGDCRVVVEKNAGGNLLKSTLDHAARKYLGGIMPPIQLIHAKVGKKLRAEPLSAAIERHDVMFVGVFEEMEMQMCSWNPTNAANEKSPDILDATAYCYNSLSKSAVGPITVSYGGTSYSNSNSKLPSQQEANKYCGYR